MVSWEGICGCCIGAAAFYLWEISCKAKACTLQSVTRVSHIEGLTAILDSASAVQPLMVTVSGIVGSDTAIFCHRSGISAVIVEETVKQHFLEKNKDGVWIQDYKLMLSTSKKVPWHLDDGTARVNIVGACHATGLSLSFGSKVFEGPREIHLCGRQDCSEGLKMLGVTRTERVLPIGTSLTVVGEAIKDHAGMIQILRPYNGPFYVSRKSIDELIESWGVDAKICHFFAVGFAAFGVLLLASQLLELFLERSWWHQVPKRSHARATHRAARIAEGTNVKAGREPPSSKKDNLKQDMCGICSEQQYNAVFLPCCHMFCCMTCSSRLTYCPLCRRGIHEAVRSYSH